MVSSSSTSLLAVVSSLSPGADMNGVYEDARHETGEDAVGTG